MASDTLAARAVNTRTESADTSGVGTEATSLYRFGWHVDLWDRGRNANAIWHAAGVVAWRLWNAPSDHARALKRLQARRCAETGKRLLKSAEIDHRIPLYRVWREYRDVPWPLLLSFWGVPNLQVINREIHAAKCATEARDRRPSNSNRCSDIMPAP